MLGRQATAVAASAGIGAIGQRPRVRVMLLAACFALTAQGTVEQVRAVDTDTGGAGQANVQVCEAAGGEAEVTSWQYGNGSQFVSVECHGGYLDGWDCYHSSATGTWQCSTSFIVPDDATKVPGALDLDPTANGGGRIPRLRMTNAQSFRP